MPGRDDLQGIGVVEQGGPAGVRGLVKRGWGSHYAGMRTQAVLPDGTTVRPPEVGDAEAIFGLLAGYNAGVVGIADCTVEQVADGLVEPGFDRGTDAWLVVDRDGAAVGYGLAFGLGDRQDVQVEVTSPVPGVAEWLFERALGRAREIGRQAGHAEVRVDFFVYRDDEETRGLLSAQEFAVGTTYYKMRIEHDGTVTAPEVPAGVVIRREMADDASRWVAHEVIIECFTGQFGFVARPHDEWLAYRESSSTVSWSQFALLEIGGKAVAFRDCNDQSLGENSGQIGGLGVLAEYRGRGLAKYLLRDAFALDAAAGLSATTLLVDTNNPTKALDLYLSVGMTPVLVQEGWRRTLPVG